MIPRANITAWRTHAPWPSNEQVEQDLVLSRALVSMFTREIVSTQATFLRNILSAGDDHETEDRDQYPGAFF